MAGPPVYEDGLFELSIDPSQNSLDNTFKLRFGGSGGCIWIDKTRDEKYHAAVLFYTVVLASIIIVLVRNCKLKLTCLTLQSENAIRVATGTGEPAAG